MEIKWLHMRKSLMRLLGFSEKHLAHCYAAAKVLLVVFQVKQVPWYCLVKTVYPTEHLLSTTRTIWGRSFEVRLKYLLYSSLCLLGTPPTNSNEFLFSFLLDLPLSLLKHSDIFLHVTPCRSSTAGKSEKERNEAPLPPPHASRFRAIFICHDPILARGVGDPANMESPPSLCAIISISTHSKPQPAAIPVLASYTQGWENVRVCVWGRMRGVSCTGNTCASWRWGG